MATSDAPVISMRNVNHFYGAGALRRQVLFDVTCDISPGEIVIITGPSGSGKTTVLTLAGALRSVQQGNMKVLGEELRGAGAGTLVRIRENIGFIFQLHNLLECLTALQNVELALGVERFRGTDGQAKASAMLTAVGLRHRMDHYPSQLSGGERQRVAIARALVRRPKIVLADEPTAALDKHSGREVVELLRQLARREGCAVLMVTHDNRILDIADRLMVLEDGRLSSFGEITSPHASHLLTALSRMPEKEHVEFLLGRMAEGEFLEVLKAIGAEFEQFMNVLDMGDRDSVLVLFRNLLEAVFGRITDLLGAEGASLLAVRNGERHTVISTGCGEAIRPALPDLGAHARIVNDCGDHLGAGVRSVLFVPIRGRHDEVRAVAQMVNKRAADRFTPADERLFRDLSGPLGLILEGCERVVARAESGRDGEGHEIAREASDEGLQLDRL
jgi:putative ABC transport system ATP-binding protein